MSRLHRFHRMNTQEYQQELKEIMGGVQKSDNVPDSQAEDKETSNYEDKEDSKHDEKKSSLTKMSRPRITFPQFSDITNRPDQDVKTLENERQKKLFGRQVANAEFGDTELKRPTRLSGTRKVLRSKDELIDAYGKRVAGIFDRNTSGLSHNTPQGPKSAVLAGKLRSKFEEGDEDYDAKIADYQQKVQEARDKFEQDYDAWRNKAKELPIGSPEYKEHMANMPKFNKPRRPAKTLKETTSLSPEKMVERGRAMDATIEHEGFHDTIARIENKYGPVASGKIVKDLISQHNPETMEAVRDFLVDSLNYKEGTNRFNEELIAHARDILVNPVKRQKFKQYLQNKLGAGSEAVIDQHIKNLKQGHQKAYERAKKISLADIRPDLAPKTQKLAASEMAKIKHLAKFKQMRKAETEEQPEHQQIEMDGVETAHPHSFYYIAGTEPEHIAASEAGAKYVIELPEEAMIYDISQDPMGYEQQVRELNNGAFDMDLMHELIKQGGYHGFIASNHPNEDMRNIVAIYHHDYE